MTKTDSNSSDYPEIFLFILMRVFITTFKHEECLVLFTVIIFCMCCSCMKSLWKLNFFNFFIFGIKLFPTVCFASLKLFRTLYYLLI